MGEIDFAGLNRRALDCLDRLCADWLPGGRVRGHEYQCSDLRGGEGSSLSVNLTSGVWCDFANPEDTGSDPISLLAAVRGIGMGEAAKELAEWLGMPASSATRRPAEVKRERKPQAQPVFPVPDGVPEPTFKAPAEWGKITARWEYRDAAGALMLYVVRFETPEGKGVRPYSWAQDDKGKMRWCWKGPVGDALRPLYGLDRLAANPEANVLMVEGEKTADAAQRLFPDLVAVAWVGGTTIAQKRQIDLSPLAGRKVVLWPDSDHKRYRSGPKEGTLMPYWEQPGELAMLAIAGDLRDLAKGVRIVATQELPPADGWDLADGEAEGWTTEQAMAYLKEHLREPIEKPAEPEGQDLPTEDHGNHEPEPEEPGEIPPPPEDIQDNEPPVLASTAHYTPLGYDKSVYFYLANGTRQILALDGHRHSKLGLIQLAPLMYWEREYAGEKGVRWDSAADSCMQSCTSVGVWDPGRVRGRGCWWDRGRMVVHLGDRLVVDGQPMPTTAIRSGHVYEGAASMPGPAAQALTARESRKIVEIAKQFRWEMPASAALMCGWIALAPICGSLRWRPHIWITGGSGSGKTTVVETFLAPLCAGTEIRVQGASTEAGIRQTLRADARPVLIDESEANDLRERQRMEAIIALIRQSSTESGAKTLRGTTGGTAMSFHVRSMFCLSSIGVSINRQEDLNRIAVLGLRSNAAAGIDPVTRAEHWRKLEADLDAMAADKTLPGRLLARIVGMVPTIQTNIRTFVRVAAVHFGNQRLGDQYGTLLAGCYALWNDGEATEEQAKELIGRFDWTTYTEEAEDDQSAACLSSILQAQVRVDQDRGAVTATLGELVAVVERGGGSFAPIAAEAALLRHGVKIEGRRLIIANQSDALERLLRDTRWASGWGKTLKRMPGATREGTSYFAQGHLSRATGIPLEAAIGVREPEPA